MQQLPEEPQGSNLSRIRGKDAIYQFARYHAHLLEQVLPDLLTYREVGEPFSLSIQDVVLDPGSVIKKSLGVAVLAAARS
jgi:hypothetical protein